MGRHVSFFLIWTLLILLTSSCHYGRHSDELESSLFQTLSHEEENFVVFLVDAKHLDYSDGKAFVQSLAKNPHTGSKEGSVGHAWIYLEGVLNGERIVVEGGHSGELGFVQPKYFDGIMNYVEYGALFPKTERSYEPNPIKYLWAVQHDGFFQKGSGKHIPTYAVKVKISEEQLRHILHFLFSNEYCFEYYSLGGNQCCSLLVQIAHLIDLKLECQKVLSIEQFISFGNEKIQLWSDPCYSRFTFNTPDVLEQSLRQTVKEGKGECVLSWYKRTHSRSFKERLTFLMETIQRFPSRLERIKK